MGSFARKVLLLVAALLGALVTAFFAGIQAGLLVLLGVGFGLVLQGFRFGFTSGWRNWILFKDPRGLYGQMILMVAASVVSIPLLADHPQELAGAVAPISWSLLIGAFVFGIAMQVADGCGSGTLYKAGASAPLAWVTLPAFIVGSTIGASHQPAWLSLGGPFSAVSFIERLGLAPALIITLAGCGLVSAIVFRRGKGMSAADRACGPSLPRWVVGALLLALLYVIHLAVAGQPWGIVYGLGLWGAKIASGLGVSFSQDAFWGVAPHAQRLADPVLWDITSLTNFGLLFGALMAARWKSPSHKAGSDEQLTSQKSELHIRHWVAAALAGVVMGYSSRLAFGCNIGGFLAGVASASLHGWVWFVCAFLGSMIGVRLRLRLNMP